MTMSKTKNKWKDKYKFDRNSRRYNGKLRDIALGGIIYVGISTHCGDTPSYKYGKPGRDSQTDRLKGLKRVMTRQFRNYIKQESKQKIQEELEE